MYRNRIVSFHVTYHIFIHKRWFDKIGEIMDTGEHGTIMRARVHNVRVCMVVCPSKEKRQS